MAKTSLSVVRTTHTRLSRVRHLLRRPVGLVLMMVASSFVILATAPPASALALDVRVTIKQVDALDSLEEPGDADFYGIVTIDGTERQSDQCQFEDDDHITPNWEFKKENVDLSAGTVNVSIEIWDDDDPCDGPFTLRGDDDQADITPHAGRTLDFTVSLAPCTLTGGVTAGCQVDVQSAGTADDDIASIIFQVAVDEPPSAPGMNVRCLHTPLWPQPGDTVTIRVEYLDGNLQPDTKLADKVQVFTGNNQATPASEVSSAEELTFTSPAVSGSTFSYACRIVDDAIPIWTGWRSVQVGASSDPSGAVPVMFTGPMASRVDVVLIPDGDSYSTGAMSAAFQTDMRALIDAAYFAQGDATADAGLLLTNQDTFNIWLAGATGSADGVDGDGKCQKSPPGNWDALYGFADVGAIIHTDDFRDCASGNTFSSEQDDWRVFRHEQGHRPFGMADEYCCDGGYFQTDELPNVYEDGSACEADAPALGRAPGACRGWQSTRNDEFYETSEPMSGDLMVDNTTPQAADIRRITWMLDTQCASGNC